MHNKKEFADKFFKVIWVVNGSFKRILLFLYWTIEYNLEVNCLERCYLYKIRRITILQNVLRVPDYGYVIYLWILWLQSAFDCRGKLGYSYRQYF